MIRRIFIFLFLIMVTGYVVVQLASHEIDAVQNNNRSIISKQQAPVQSRPGDEEGFEVGNIAPDFTVDNLYGQPVRLSSYRGTVVVLEFWASWCPPCNAAIPRLITLQERFKDNKFTILAVAIDEGGDVIDKLLHFVDEHKMNYQVLLHNDDIMKAYNAKSVPTTFIIDKQGHIANKYIGLDESSYESSIPAQIGSLLQE